IKVKPIKQQIEYLLDVDVNENHYVFDALNDVVKNASKKQIQLVPELIKQIFEKILNNETVLHWAYTGNEELIYSLCLHIETEDLFIELLTKAITKIQNNKHDRVEHWIDAYWMNIDIFCRARAMAYDQTSLKSGLENWLDVLENFCDSKELIKHQPIPNTEVTENPLQTWSEFTEKYLSDDSWYRHT
ncbi:MAG: hypothetical protein QNL04_07710, partial [SAR324 cluster bacterium]|nr:hypothetical protein [SAR324 cluster bacterium]